MRVCGATFSPTTLRAGSLILAMSSEISGGGVIGSGLVTLDGESGVVTTEAKTIAQNGVDVALDGSVGRVVEVELGLRSVVVDRWRNDARSHNHGTNDGFDRTGRAQHVPRRGFCGADVHALCVLAEDRLDGARFVAVVGGVRRGVGVDVLDILGFESSVLEGT